MGFLGVVLGLAQGLAGLLGTVVGGALADRLGARNFRTLAIIPACSSLIAIPFYLGLFSTESIVLAFVFNGLGFFFCSIWYGPAYTIVQSVVSPSNRPTATALMMLMISVLGIGFGPLAAGIVSDIADNVGHLGSAEGLRVAMLLSPLGLVVAGPMFFAARKTLHADFVG